MKTIEERAKEKANALYPYIGGVKGMICDIDKMIFTNGYIHGATEQKRVDVEIMLEWLKNNLPVMSDEDIDKCQWKVITKENLEALLDDFHKTMEV